MTTIFLDIDGVIQPFSSLKRENYNLDKVQKKIAKNFNNNNYLTYDKYDLGAVYFDWHKDAITNLNKLIKKTNAILVISSSWRVFCSFQMLKDYFTLHDLDSFIIDVTPIISKNDRGEEINSYLSQNLKIKNFVIIDDLDLGISKIFPQNFVHITNSSYFSSQYYKKALEILTKT